MTSRRMHNLGVHHCGAPRQRNLMQILSQFTRVSQYFFDLIIYIPVLSEYAKVLETHIKRRYLQKISLVVVDPASIPSDQFNPECLPSIDEATDLVVVVVFITDL